MPLLRLPQDAQISFSAELATALGVEGAILMEQLRKHTRHRPPGQGGWHDVEMGALRAVFPFWDQRDIARIARHLEECGTLRVENTDLGLRYRLRDKPPPSDEQGGRPIAPDWQPSPSALKVLEREHGIMREQSLRWRDTFVIYWGDCGKRAHSWDSKFITHVLRKNRQEAVQQGEIEMSKNWRPLDFTLQELERFGVSKLFIERTIPEFIVYWMEKDSTAGTWNNKFLTHTQRQWERYQSLQKQGGEMTAIKEDWTPCQDAYRVLEMVGITREFALSLLPEFRLYWKDRGTLRASWNICFINRVREKWGEKNKLAGSDWEKFIGVHGDMSWPEEKVN